MFFLAFRLGFSLPHALLTFRFTYAAATALPLLCTDRYVHTLTKGAPDMANIFAQQHSLSKLAQSLRPFWARSPGSTGEEVSEWDQCMLSLLEIASSVAVMTGERDILSDLDADVFAGVTEVRVKNTALLASCTPNFIFCPWFCSNTDIFRDKNYSATCLRCMHAACARTLLDAWALYVRCGPPNS